MLLLEGLLNNVTVHEHLFNLQSVDLRNYTTARANVQQYAPYRCPPGAARLLEEMGIATDPHAIELHPHPVCKTIETYILLNHLPHLFSAPLTVYWTKESKAQVIADAVGQAVTAVNLAITPKDFLRYRTYYDHLPSVETQGLFIHDAAHHLSPLDCHAIFDRSPELQYMICTVVIPPELLDDQPCLMPDLYTFKHIEDGIFEFYPDGHVAGGYPQHIDCLWWLRTNRINGPHLTLRLAKLESYGAHHIILVTKRPCEPPTHYSFKFPGRVQLAQEIVPYLSRRYRSIDGSLYKKVLSYVTSVGAVKPYQVKARARAAAHTSPHQVPLADEFVAVEHAVAINAHNMAFIPDNLPVIWPHHIVTRCGPVRWVRFALNAYHRAAWESFLHTLDPPPYTATQRLQMHSLSKWDRNTTAITGTLKPMGHRDLYNLIVAIIKGPLAAHANNEELLGGAPLQPYFSTYLVNRVFDHYFPSVVTITRARWCLKFVWRCIRLAGRNPRWTIFLAPAIMTFLIFAFHTLTKGYTNLKKACAARVHALPWHKWVPPAIMHVYLNLKLAAAPAKLHSHAASSGAPIPPRATRTRHRPGAEVEELMDEPLRGVVEKGRAPAHPLTSHGDKTWTCIADCLQHSQAEGVEWLTCMNGHGYTPLPKHHTCHACLGEEPVITTENAPSPTPDPDKVTSTPTPDDTSSLDDALEGPADGPKLPRCSNMRLHPHCTDPPTNMQAA
jgi:hypothetical protein